MRVAVLFGLALASACGGARPAAVTVVARTGTPRPAEEGFAATGQIERELAALVALDATRPDTRPARYVREIDLLVGLARCGEARTLADEIATKGDEPAKRVAGSAIAECARLARAPTSAELARMRDAFHRARSLEPTDPSQAEKLYAEAWTDAPSVAAMLGLARAAKAAGEAALAERSFERALAFVESTAGEKATLAVTPGLVPEGFRLVPMDVSGGAAIFAGEAGAEKNGWLLRQDLATGALRVLAGIPAARDVAAATDRFALLAAKPPGKSDAPRLLEIGIDDELTARPLDALAGADELALSADGSIAVGRAGGTVSIVDLASGKLLAKPTLAGDASWVGVTADRDVVAREPGVMCVLSPPSYGACRVDASLNATSNAPYEAKPVVAGRRVAFLDGFSAVRVYDVHDSRVVRNITGKFIRVSSLSLSPDGATLITTSFTRGHYIWDLATGAHVTANQIGGLDDREAPVWADSKRVVVRHDGVGQHSSRVYTLPGRTLSAAGALPVEHAAVAFGARGTLWVGGLGVVSSVDLARRTVRTFSVDDASCVDVVVSPDDSLVAVRLDSAEVDVLDAAGKRVASGEVYAGAMRFEGRNLVVTGDSTEQVLDLDTQKITTRPASRVAPPDAAARGTKSPDGKWLARNGDDGRIAIENTATKAISTLDLAGDAYVLTADGKGAIGGDATSAGCRVGAVWLPLDACRARLLESP